MRNLSDLSDDNFLSLSSPLESSSLLSRALLSSQELSSSLVSSPLSPLLYICPHGGEAVHGSESREKYSIFTLICQQVKAKNANCKLE
jgi:hypothetical protein